MDLLIFVTLGTQDKSFHRLLEKLDKMIDSGIIQDEVIVQAGSTVYKSDHMKIFDYIDMAEFNAFIERCDLLITHAGVGTIINGINHHKKILAVARREKYGEHENEHQVEITMKFAKLGYIIGCIDVDEIDVKFPKLDFFETHPYVSNNQAFCQLIKSLIDC